MRYWGSTRVYKPIGSKSYFSKVEIDYTSSNFNPEQFLLQEFFKTNETTLERIIDAYKSLHGNGAASYFKRRIVEWRHGNAAVTDLMKGRILELMPRFLNEEKRFHLLKFEVTNQITQLHTKYRNQTKSITEVTNIYQQEVEQINSIDTISLSWFTNKGVFTAEEKFEFLEISKYMLKQRLRQSYNQIIKDFELISSLISKIDKGLHETVYYVDYLNFRVNIEKKLIETEFPPLQGVNLELKELKSRYKPYIEKYIFYELNNVNYIKLKSEVEASLTENDFKLIIEQYEWFKNFNKEGDIKSTFKGEGGILKLYIEVKSLINIRYNHFLKILQLLGLLVFCIILLSLFIIFEWLNVITLFLGIYFTVFAYFIFKNILKDTRCAV